MLDRTDHSALCGYDVLLYVLRYLCSTDSTREMCAMIDRADRTALCRYDLKYVVRICAVQLHPRRSVLR